LRRGLSLQVLSWPVPLAVNKARALLGKPPKSGKEFQVQ
jgi:hypothetical protein